MAYRIFQYGRTRGRYGIRDNGSWGWIPGKPSKFRVKVYSGKVKKWVTLMEFTNEKNATDYITYLKGLQDV